MKKTVNCFFKNLVVTLLVIALLALSACGVKTATPTGDSGSKATEESVQKSEEPADAATEESVQKAEEPADASSSEIVTIKYWTHENPAFVAHAQQLVEEFNKTHPNIKVEHEYFTEFNTKVYSSFAAKTEPDVIEMYGGVLRFAKGGTIAPVPSDVMSDAEIKGTYWPATLENRFYEGKYYGLPEELNLESPGLLVNTALIQEAGLTIPDTWKRDMGPSSWDELTQFAKKLTKVDGETMQQAGLGVIGGEEIAMFLSLIWQMGGEYKDPEKMQVHFNTPTGIKAAEFIMNLIEGPNQVHSAQFSGRFDGFKEGTIAMTIGAPWYTAVLNQDVKGLEYEYYNLPPFIEGAKPYFVGEGGWGPIVSSRTKYPKETWEFVKFMMNSENQLNWAKSVGCIPARKDLQDNEYFTTGDGRKVFFPALSIAEYAIDPGAYTIDPYQMVWDIDYRNLTAITSKEVTIEEGLKNMEDQTNDMIKKLQESE